MGINELTLLVAIIWAVLTLVATALLIEDDRPIVRNEWTPDPELEARAIDEREWVLFWEEARFDGLMAFDDLYNSYETKWSKNNRLMLRIGDSGPYRFVKAA